MVITLIFSLLGFGVIPYKEIGYLLSIFYYIIIFIFSYMIYINNILHYFYKTIVYNLQIIYNFIRYSNPLLKKILLLIDVFEEFMLFCDSLNNKVESIVKCSSYDNTSNEMKSYKNKMSDYEFNQ